MIGVDRPLVHEECRGWIHGSFCVFLTAVCLEMVLQIKTINPYSELEESRV